MKNSKGAELPVGIEQALEKPYNCPKCGCESYQTNSGKHGIRGRSYEAVAVQCFNGCPMRIFINTAPFTARKKKWEDVKVVVERVWPKDVEASKGE